jgi:hypothetical protein
MVTLRFKAKALPLFVSITCGFGNRWFTLACAVCAKHKNRTVNAAEKSFFIFFIV